MAAPSSWGRRSRSVCRGTSVAPPRPALHAPSPLMPRRLDLELDDEATFLLDLGHPSCAVTIILTSLLLGMGVGSMTATAAGAPRLQRLGLGVAVAIFVGAWACLRGVPQ